jgi:hypothetical protein
MKKLQNILLSILITTGIYGQSGLDAGIISPLNLNVKMTVSSGENAEFIRDGNTDTFWESDNPLPNNFIGSNEQNVFLDDRNFEVLGDNNKYLMAFDGNTDTRVNINKKALHIKLYNNQALKFLVLKFSISDDLHIEFKFANGKSQRNTFNQQQNYSLQTVNIESNSVVKEIILVSRNPFELFELAAVDSDIVEKITFEFPQIVEIGVIMSNHLNWEGVDSIILMYSNDSVNWLKMKNLMPRAVAKVALRIDPAIYARFLKIEIYLRPIPYNKASYREFAVYDRYGLFGKPPEARPTGNSWGESFGINAIWGWGYGVPSSKLTSGQGSAKFNKITTQARNYHRIDWDIDKPGSNAEFILRENIPEDSLHNKWLNWKQEYGVWRRNGMYIDACILFNNEYFPEQNWTSPFSQGKLYARQFAGFFGRKNMVSMVEIGNEPWDYSKRVYSGILNGMAEGFSDSPFHIKVLPCGLQAFDKYSVNNNYLPDFVSRGTKIDGLNTHIYSYIFDDEGNRRAINPEDPRSETWSVNNLRNWAISNNFPNNIYVTEFGFDSEGGGEDCTHTNCISEFEQAIFGFRQAMIFYRLGVEKFYWYFYANVDWNSIMHNRSGLVSSYSAGFHEKLSFKTFQRAFSLLKDLYFKELVSENDDLYCYALADKNGLTKALVAWRPTSDKHEIYKWVEIQRNYKIKEVTDITNPSKSISYKREVNKIKISLSGAPVIIQLRDGH